MKARKDAARPEHAAAKDILSRMIEAKGWIVSQEEAFFWDFAKRQLRIDVVARPPRRAKGPKPVGFELQRADVAGKIAEVRLALSGGVAGFEDVHVIPIAHLKFSQPQAEWMEYLSQWVDNLEQFN